MTNACGLIDHTAHRPRRVTWTRIALIGVLAGL